MGLRIAYIGPAHGTSLHRANALKRLGHDVTIVDPWKWVAVSPWVQRWLVHAGGFGVSLVIKRRLMVRLASANPQLIFVNQGEFLAPKLVREMRQFGVPIINYANDNPFGRDNVRRFREYRAALPHYDLAAVVFDSAAEAAREAGARKVVRTFICADEVAHNTEPASPKMADRYRSEVAFVGTWMKTHRGQFLAELVELGVPLSIWGDNWQKSPDWPMLKPHWRGPGVYDDAGYAAIIKSAKVCLGLLNKASGNLHTGRSVQIPSMGGLLCAERTSEHQMLYREGEEAVMWSNAAECAALCKRLLADDALRQKIAERGYQRAVQNGNFNEPMLTMLIEEAFEDFY